MRYFAQAFILIVGLSAAIVAMKVQQRSPTIGNCYEVAATSAPTICE